MKLRLIGLAAIATMTLVGCVKQGGGESVGHHGRYVGIGIYRPEEPWTKMVAAQQSEQTPSAKTIDDQAIIVVVDSDTGDIRACGDLTGYCIGMNPWKKALTTSQIAPINLTQHVKPSPPVAEAPVDDAAQQSAAKK